MIELFKHEIQTGNELFVFIDKIYVSKVEVVYKINHEYLEFMKTYENLSKKERNEVNCPTKWLFDYYDPYDFHTKNKTYSISDKPRTLEELESYLRNYLSFDFIFKSGIELVPV